MNYIPTFDVPTHDGRSRRSEKKVDVYFSADVETDGPIPGSYSILSFGIVYAGSFDGQHFVRPRAFDQQFYCELQPISDRFQPEALQVNGLNREHLKRHGSNPRDAMNEAGRWIRSIAGTGNPVLVAYPVSFDWTWLYWYFTEFADEGSPFGYSHCFDVKTAVAVKGHMPIVTASRSKLPPELLSNRPHTHNALDDAVEQAEIFANVFEWE